MSKKPEPAYEDDAVNEALSSLAALRDVNAGFSDEDREVLRAWERMIKSHALRKKWLKDPITQEIFGKLTEQIVAINTRLSTEIGMDEKTRHGIFNGKLAYMWLLSLFSDSKDTVMLETLTKEIQAKTEQFESYNRLTP